MAVADVIHFSSPDFTTFPATRYHGSKRKLLAFLHERFAALKFDSALDLFSGSGIVSLLLRSMGKQVDANDYLPFNRNTAELFLGLTDDELPSIEQARIQLHELLTGELHEPALVSTKFCGIFFTDDENEQIDRFCQNLASLPCRQRSLYTYAVGQALLMKRPFSLFHRSNLNLRMADVARSFGNKATWDRPILDHALTAIRDLRRVVWEAPAGAAFAINTQHLDQLPDHYDVIYVDPPYISGSANSVNYADFYHFLTGLVEYGQFEHANQTRRHTPILALPSNWVNPVSALAEIDNYVIKWPNSTFVLSYRSDGQPTPAQLTEVLSAGGRCCTVYDDAFQYALSKRQCREMLFVSTNKPASVAEQETPILTRL